MRSSSRPAAITITSASTPGSRPAGRRLPRTTGLYHVAINYPTRAALGDALRRLLDANWQLDGASDHGTHEALYLRDPDQNGLELAWDRPEPEWPRDADGKLAFGRAQPDLDSLLAAAAAGAEASPRPRARAAS